ncbi:hydroperoxide isomerase ALOXE3-like isoform X2 [Pseudorasbora parva]|uniref:hydroperoxide isomerase ALOXE3-like isoform X2 n=1 Tax=Pseudorasbora parva TaxID=51549 RepID=UPI00351EE788
MVIYTVTVYTGKWLTAGTFNPILIQLHGTEDGSEEHTLNSSFSGGSVQEFKIEMRKSLGELITLKLTFKPDSFFHKQWFCDKLSVNTPEGVEVLFPCYRWLDFDEGIILRTAKASLVFQDTNPIAQRQRKRQLEERQKLFRWRVYAQGLPQIIDCDNFETLPAEVQFSKTKSLEFRLNFLNELAALQTNGKGKDRSSWESFSEIKQETDKNKTIEYIQEHWDEDEFFGYQFLNGLNPMMIQRCSKLPENFPVTDDMVKDFLGGSSLEQEMKNGNIFLSDYKILDGLAGNVVSDRQQYLTAPLVLLYCNPQAKMMPIAIQLGQKPSKENPIFLPSDSKDDWKLVKIFVRSAEFAVHEVDVHLLRTHLLSEVFTVATLRHLPSPHPLFKLLIPHTRYTFQINILARNQLINDKGAITLYSGIGGESLGNLLKRATASLTYSSLCLPGNILERGLEKVPSYYYREHGMKMWNIINKFVAALLSHCYQHDAHVQKDTELQCWISEIFTNGFLERESSDIGRAYQVCYHGDIHCISPTCRCQQWTV